MSIFKNHNRNSSSCLISYLVRTSVQSVRIFSEQKMIKDFRNPCLGQRALWKEDKYVKLQEFFLQKQTMSWSVSKARKHNALPLPYLQKGMAWH